MSADLTAGRGPDYHGLAMGYRSHPRTLVLAIAAAGLVAPAVFAQQPAPRTVATLVNPEGSVLVSNATGLGTGTNGAPLRNGMRVITPANARATIRFEDGCVVELKPNQRLVIDDRAPCEARLLQAQSTAPQPQGAQQVAGNGAPAGSGLPSYVGYAGGALFTVVGIERWRRGDNGGTDRNEPISPN